MQVREIMTPDPEVMRPDATVAEVARKMRDLDVGDIPIMGDGEIVGIVTDRDIAIRAVAEGVDPSSKQVADIMSKGVKTVNADEQTDQAVKVMEGEQIRRLPVVDQSGKLVGIVSLGDLAVAKDKRTAGEAIKEVSKPAEPER